MIPIPFDDLTYELVSQRLLDGVREGERIEFKQALVGTRDDDKREFLADVSAFANASGGDIIFGITEAEGEAHAIPGITGVNQDAELLRLESILASGLEPRIPGLRMRWLPGPISAILIIRVNRSWARPHRVTFRDHSKFYSRHSSGKYALNVLELRDAFLSQGSVSEQLRQFRNERIGTLEAGENVVDVLDGPKLFLQLIATESYFSQSEIMTKLASHELVVPIESGGSLSSQHCLDGHATFIPRVQSELGSRGYALVMRIGVIEAYRSLVPYFKAQYDGVHLESIEDNVRDGVSMYLKALKKLGGCGPFVVLISLLDVRGQKGLTDRRYGVSGSLVLRQNKLLFPEIVIEGDGPENPDSILRPTFDRLWNAFGFSRSLSYNEDGSWITR